MIQKTDFTIGNTLVQILMQNGFSERQGKLSEVSHCHPNMELHYIEKGSFDFKFDARRLTVNEGSLLLIPKKQYHSYTVSDEGFRKVSFELKFTEKSGGADTFSEYDRIFSDISVPSCFSLPSYELDELSRRRGVIVSEEEKSRLNAYFLIIFLRICDVLRSQNSSNGILKNAFIAEAAPGDSDVTLIKLLEFIRSHCKEKLTVKQVAQSTGLSERQLQRLLASKMGESFKKLLASTRIEEAKQLMLSPNGAELSLEEIAYLSGYSDYVSFWKQFKALTGENPKSFRGSVNINSDHED